MEALTLKNIRNINSSFHWLMNKTERSNFPLSHSFHVFSERQIDTQERNVQQVNTKWLLSYQGNVGIYLREEGDGWRYEHSVWWIRYCHAVESVRKTVSPTLTGCVSPIDTVLSTDYWISHFQLWWKNQSHVAQKNVTHHYIHTVYHEYMCVYCAELWSGGVYSVCVSSGFGALSPWTCYNPVF